MALVAFAATPSLANDFIPTSAADVAGRADGSDAFNRLSSADQRVAWALYLAQADGLDGCCGVLLELDDLAAYREAGLSWEQIFAQLKGDGLVAAEIVDVSDASRRFGRVQAAEPDPGEQARSDRWPQDRALP